MQANSPKQFDSKSPKLALTAPFMGRREIPLTMLAQGSGIFGVTGSGKSSGAVGVLIQSMLAHKHTEGGLFSGLVLDPKHELYGITTELADSKTLKRCQLIGRGQLRFNLFEFIDSSLSASEAYNEICRLTGIEEFEAGEATIWLRKGQNFVGDFVRLEEAADKLLGIDRPYVMERLMGEWENSDKKDPASLAHQVVSNILGNRHNWAYFRRDFFSTVNAFIEQIQSDESFREYAMLAFREANSLHNRLPNPLGRFRERNSNQIDQDMLHQVFYYAGIMRPLLERLSSETLTGVLNVDPVRRVQLSCASVKELLDGDGILFYQPEYGGDDILKTVGKLLRNMFIQWVVSRENPDKPVMYVCDEYHRFASGQGANPDHEFFSWARAYRVCAVICSQSLAAIKASLALEKNAKDGEAVLEALVTNCANKVFFRSTDDKGTAVAQSLCGSHTYYDLPSVIAARPLNKLRVGEYFWSDSMGEFGIQAPLQIHELFASRHDPGLTVEVKVA